DVIRDRSIVVVSMLICCIVLFNVFLMFKADTCGYIFVGKYDAYIFEVMLISVWDFIKIFNS
ncbi:hypothetical protein CXF82_00535, partial [Shewanella sp. GutDb-MelDb]